MAQLQHRGVAGTRVHLPEIDEPVAFDEHGVSEEIDDEKAIMIAADLAGYALIVAEPSKSATAKKKAGNAVSPPIDATDSDADTTSTEPAV